MVYRLLGRCLRIRNNRYEGAIFRFRVVLDAAVNESEQGVIFTNADIFPGVPFRATLAHDDAAGVTGFAAKKLHAEPLTRRVAPVP